MNGALGNAPFSYYTKLRKYIQSFVFCRLHIRYVENCLYLCNRFEREVALTSGELLPANGSNRVISRLLRAKA